MRVGYLDCFSGISGDMLLGALAAAGAPREELSALPGHLGLHHVELSFEDVKRGGVAATKAHVKIEKPADGHHHHRSLSIILKMIAAAGISDAVKDSASRVFRKLGEAEASIHGVPVEKVHFHEVGAEDSIVDIVGGCLGLRMLTIEKLVCSPLDVGAGTVETAHGRLPVPAPATTRLLVGAPVYSSGIEAELVTPTGAAMVATLATFGAMPRMTISGDGYGAGLRDLPGRTNVLRLVIGTEETDAATTDAVTVLEANLDDMSPQVAGFVLGKAIAMGALDCYFTSVQMKKGRPGLLITVLAAPADAGRLTGLLFSETSTLGVRSYPAVRRTLQRRHETVETTWGPVRVKVASRNGEELHFAPEYDDCLALAEEHHVPLKHVLEQASASYLKTRHS
jgi:uncharacterized protein (TIGR00299 family) protein